MPTTYSPTTPLNPTQLTASSTAATTHGVPVNIVRGVTAFKYGPRATAADFEYVGGQLSNWYKHYYLQSGNALIAWQRAAAQEMGPAASPNQILDATSNQAAATTTILTAPLFADVGSALAGVGSDVGAATAGETGLTGADTAGDTTGGSTGSSGDTSSSDSGSGTSTAAKTAAVAATGLAGLLGVGGIEELLIRGLEALVAVALILLGLAALTGNQGKITAAATTATKAAVA